MALWGLNGLFFHLLWLGPLTVLVLTHAAKQLLFFMLPSIMTFDFDLILGSFCFIGAKIGCFWGWGNVQKQF